MATTTEPLAALVAEARFRAMGSDAHVIAVGAAPWMVDAARRRIAELEARWTRFAPDSELVRLDRAGGRPVLVSTDTHVLVERMLDGWLASGGAFNPTLRDSIEGLGYTHDFGTIGRGAGDHYAGPGRGAAPQAPDRCTAHLEAVEIDPVVPAVRLPAGLRLDAGGIGKGLAADLVTAEMLAAGAQGAMVSIGGDLRVRGRAPHPAGWVVAVESPHAPGRVLATVALADGGVCTSSTRRRRWRHRGAEVHHLLDPSTGAPWEHAVASVTAVAGEAWWAEVATKVAMGARPGSADATLPNTAILAVHDDASITCSDPDVFALSDASPQHPQPGRGGGRA